MGDVMVEDSLTAPSSNAIAYAPFHRPWWSRIWVWVTISLAVAIAVAVVVVGSSASAAGGCGGG
jgi:hypothetical protein